MYGATSASFRDPFPSHNSDDDDDDENNPPRSRNLVHGLITRHPSNSLLLTPENNNNDDDDDVEAEIEMNDDEMPIDVSKFTLPTDPNSGYRAKKINILSFARPHMRAFHGSWICFQASFLVWFAFAPLLPEVKRTLNLSREDIWLTNVLSVGSAVVMRLILGPLCDKHGARVMMTGLLAFCAIPSYLSGTVQNLWQLALLRTIIGLVGGNFVSGQCWTSCHFTREVGGTAMAIVGGWGAMGGGIAQIFMGSAVFPLCKWIVAKLNNDDDDDDDSGLAWRISFIIPSTLAMAVACYFYKYSDDCPLGNFVDVKKAGLMVERSAMDSFRSGVVNLNAWILFFQFSASLGVELTMENGAALYYHEHFNQSIEVAAAYASLFGLTNFFARGFGGYVSDQMNKWMSLRGRLLAQMICMFLEGIMILCFGRCQTIGWSVAVMLLFSIFTQMSMGTCFGIVPYVDPPNTGSIAGIVGAGGNMGAILFGNVFRSHSFEYSYTYMGVFAILMSLLTPFILIKGYKGICLGKEVEKETTTTMTGTGTKSSLLVPK